MAAIWSRSTAKWAPLAPAGFPDEARLHDLIDEAPHMLPLSGAPRLTVVGREVQLGAGYADLLAVERDGRVAVIEIKLARNAEARRAVVSQVLAYASYLHGLSSEAFEELLMQHLRRRGASSLAALLQATDQEGSFDPEVFQAGLAASLAEGRFRLVFVLDSAPDELVRLSGYLESIADKVVIDLVTITAYQVDGTALMVPQRMDPGRREAAPPGVRGGSKQTGTTTPGADAFERSIQSAEQPERDRLTRLLRWARQVEAEGLAELSSFKGLLERWILLPRLRPDNAGLVTLWNEGGAAIQYWRSVFDRRAPEFISKVEAKLGRPIGQGTTTRDFDDELLALLLEAYRVAAKAG
jgi:hypothetical protein